MSMRVERGLNCAVAGAALRRHECALRVHRENTGHAERQEERQRANDADRRKAVTCDDAEEG
jgi:hypothetical protein